MKKTILLIITMVLIVTSCTYEPIEELEKIPIDCRYTEAYEAIETEYVEKYSWGRGEYVLVPNVYTVKYPEKYEILYSVSYSNGSSEERWEEVDRNTYLSFKGGESE